MNDHCTRLSVEADSRIDEALSRVTGRRTHKHDATNLATVAYTLQNTSSSVGILKSLYP